MRRRALFIRYEASVFVFLAVGAAGVIGKAHT